MSGLFRPGAKRISPGVFVWRVIIAVLTLPLSGCVIARYTHTVPVRPARDGAITFNLATNQPPEKVTFSIYALFADEKVTHLAIDRAAAKSSTGLTIGSAESQIDNEALEAVTRAFIEGVVKGIK